MKTKISRLTALGSIAVLAMAIFPLMANADGAAMSDNGKSAEIASLKKQIYACHHHIRHHRTAFILPTQRVIERQTIIEKPVVMEKVIEKQVVVQQPGELILERPMQLENKVVVEHAAHHKHLLHLGIPFLSVNLF